MVATLTINDLKCFCLKREEGWSGTRQDIIGGKVQGLNYKPTLIFELYDCIFVCGTRKDFTFNYSQSSRKIWRESCSGS